MATLKEHEILCEIRYAAVEKRLTDLESKIDEIRFKIEDFQSFFIKLMIKTGIGFIATIAGAVFIIKV